MPAYDAFISYSHAKDKAIAAALQAVIQKLGKPWYRRRALRVFRDDTSLSATPHLWPSIEEALSKSRYLILLTSPEAAASPWVSKEVEYWLAHKDPGTLLIGVTEGDLAWDGNAGDFDWSAKTPLPSALKGHFAAEPKWVDLTAYRDGADPRDAHFIKLGADFAAAIRGMPKEDLLSQEVRQQRRALTLAVGAVGLLLVLTIGAITAGIIARQEQQRAEHNFAAAKQTIDTVIFDIAEGLQDAEGMRADTLRRILGRAEAAIGNLAANIEDEPELRRSEAAAYGLFADTYWKLGYSEQPLAYAQKSLGIIRDLAAEDEEWVSDLPITLRKLGDVLVARGDNKGALEQYREALEIGRKFAAANEDDPRWQRDVYMSLGRIGDAYWAMSDPSGALDAYEEVLDVSRKLASQHKDDPDLQRDIALALDRIGDARKAKGDIPGALAAYSEALAIGRRLAEIDPGNTQWQHDLSIGLEKVADGLAIQEDLPGALAFYRQSLDIRRKLAAKDKDHAPWLRDVAASLNRIGDALVAQDLGSWSKYLAWSMDKQALLDTGDLGPAIAAYEEGLGVNRGLVAKDPHNAQWQLDVSISLDRIADMLAARGDLAGAIERYRESLLIRRQLVAADGDNARWQIALAASLANLGQRGDDALDNTTEALAILKQLQSQGRLPARQLDWIENIEADLAKLKATGSLAPETASTDKR